MEQQSSKSQAPAFLISMFFGILGFDRFYLGQPVLGILKLVTCGGLGVWAFIDTLLIGMGAVRDSEGRPLHRPGSVGMSSKSQGVTFLLALFFGFIGADQFYLGNIVLGILKLVSCGGLGIWALIDFIITGIGARRDSEGNSLAV